jgi:hypothetical protein
MGDFGEPGGASEQLERLAYGAEPLAKVFGYTKSTKPKPCEQCGTEPNSSIISGDIVWQDECTNCGHPF